MRIAAYAALVLFGLPVMAAQADDPPVLDSLSSSLIGGNWWLITGAVTDEDVGSCTIEFGGAIAGQSTSVTSGGTFSYVVNLPSGGLISAVAVDAALQESNERETLAF
ncbi:MAG: hypothetical protein AAGJ97_09150 [Planctomycetota bacterium]